MSSILRVESVEVISIEYLFAEDIHVWNYREDHLKYGGMDCLRFEDFQLYGATPWRVVEFLGSISYIGPIVLNILGYTKVYDQSTPQQIYFVKKSIFLEQMIEDMKRYCNDDGSFSDSLAKQVIEEIMALSVAARQKLLEKQEVFRGGKLALSCIEQYRARVQKTKT